MKKKLFPEILTKLFSSHQQKIEKPQMRIQNSAKHLT